VLNGKLYDTNADSRELSEIFNFLEYTFVIDGADIFPNESIRHEITVEYKPSNYSIPKLEYSILEHKIDAWDLIVQADPLSIDDSKTEVHVKIYARNIQVTGNLVNKSYDNMNLQSIYGIYDEASDKMDVHIPISVAISLLI
jgi:hypothetical protein